MYGRHCRLCGDEIVNTSGYQDSWDEEKGICANCEFNQERPVEREPINTIALGDESIKLLSLLLTKFLDEEESFLESSEDIGEENLKAIKERVFVAETLLESIRSIGTRMGVKTH